MNHNCNRPCHQQQYRIAKQVKKVDANHFFNLLTGPQLLETVEAQLPPHRERHYPPTLTLAMFLGQILSADGSCQNAVNEAVINQMLSGLTMASANTGGYCLARQRLPLEMVSTLARHSGALLGEQTPKAWLWRGRHVKLVDGTTITMPDTQANQAGFPQHGQQAPGAGFPLARLVGAVSLATGAVLDVAMGPYQGKGNGEYGLFRRLKDVFTEGDIMLADSYFCSYFLIAEMQARGIDVLFEQHGARHSDFRTGKRLGARDHIVRWSKPKVRPEWMSPEQYREYPDEISVREVKVGSKVLVTSLLSAKTTCKSTLGELFGQRWQVELDLRNIKTTLGMEALSCRTPVMCEKEMWAYMLAYNLIRLLMAESALQAGLLPRQLSFKHTLQVWVAWSGRQFLTNAREDTRSLFILIAQIQVGNRSGRIEPRAVKRRPKPYPRLKIPREKAREIINKKGNDKMLGLN